MKIQNLILIMLLLLLTSVQAGAATVNWNISVGGPWDTSSNWNPVTVPDSEDDVFITNADAGTITVDTTAAAKTLKVGGANNITLSTGKLTIGSGDYTSHNIGILKYVPAGAFRRDALNSGNNYSTVTTAFRMSQYEITRAQFSAIMVTDPSDTGYSTGTSDPVQQVRWYHVIAFCNKLSIAEGLTRVYDVAGFTTDQDWVDLAFGDIPINVDDPAAAAWSAVTATWANTGYRLPTEMEWEWAAMGATSGSGWTSPTYLTGYGKKFAGSDSILYNGDGGTRVIGDYAWYNTNSSSTTHPVGTTGGTTDHANELGLYDMSGNVWEWVWDWYAAYPAGDLDNNTYRDVLTSGTYRVLRGGSWFLGADSVTVAFRRGDSKPDYRTSSIGFRVVRN